MIEPLHVHASARIDAGRMPTSIETICLNDEQKLDPTIEEH